MSHSSRGGAARSDYLHRQLGAFRRCSDDHLYVVGADIDTRVELAHCSLIVARVRAIEAVVEGDKVAVFRLFSIPELSEDSDFFAVHFVAMFVSF